MSEQAERVTDEELATILRGSFDGAVETLAGEMMGVRDPEGDGDGWPEYQEVARPVVVQMRAMAAELRALRARIENGDRAFNFMMHTLAAGVIETGETPEIHADKLAQQAAALLQALAALRAPVDVEREVTAAVERLRRVIAASPPYLLSDAAAGDVVRHHVQRAAVLARENAGLWQALTEAREDAHADVEDRIEEAEGALEDERKAHRETRRAKEAAEHQTAGLLDDIEQAHAILDEPAALAAALTAAEDALLMAGGWVPDARGFYVDMSGDERMSAGVSWPRSTAIDIARDRARTP